MISSLRLSVNDPSQVGEVRRRAVAWAVEQGCRQEDTSELALSVAELARNLGLHTTHGGDLLIRILNPQTGAFEILSLDRGPGMQNFGECLRDGYSTAGTSGTGLGSVVRSSQVFDIHTAPGLGTALFSRAGAREDILLRNDGFGVATVPIKGEIQCGDTCARMALDAGRTRVMVADGLGHGPLAAEASQRAAEIFLLGRDWSLTHLMDELHEALKTTRGAAVSIAEVDPARQRCLFVGVGNVSGGIISPEKSTHFACMNGTVGAAISPKVREFTYPWTSDSMLVMHSDGLKTHWSLDRYAGLLRKHPALSAGILLRDFARTTDDVTVATLKLPYEHRD